MGLIKKIITIVRKDLTLEFRTKEMLTSMFMLALLILLIFNFSLPAGADLGKIIPGILWVSFVFAGVLGINRSFSLEQEEGAINGLLLCPYDKGAIYLGKMLGNLIFMLLVEIMILPVFMVFFNLLILAYLPGLLLIIFLATLGFVSLGTLFAAMTVNTKLREVMLPILLLPLIIPLLLAAVKITAKILLGFPLNAVLPWFYLLIAYDLIFLLVSYLLFEFVVSE